MATNKLQLPTISGNMTADVVRDMNALAQAVDDKAGAVDGLATLDSNGSVPATQLSNVPVKSVNNKTGAVTLSAGDVGAAPANHTHQDATQQASGFMSADDKKKLDGIEAGAQVNEVTGEEFNAHLAETASKFTSLNVNMIDMAVELETLKGATLNGVTANIFIETFQNLNDINLMNGIYDSTNKRLVL